MNAVPRSRLDALLGRHVHSSAGFPNGLAHMRRVLPDGREIYFIVNHFQINKLRTIVHTIDSDAFISLQDVSDVIRRPEQ